MSSTSSSGPVLACLRAIARTGCVVAPLLLAACATPSSLVQQPVADLFDDAHFAPPREPVSADDVFRMSPEMTDYLARFVEPVARQKGSRFALTDALYNRSKLQLEYESSLTRTAAQAFSARQGNCLSLVIMTGAFAKALGLRVTYQEVAAEEAWSRSGGMYFVSGHVNLMLERRPADMDRHYDSELYTIDFLAGEGSRLRTRPIEEETVLAMYMNNRAAEAMVAGRLDDAYWRVREALRLDPRFTSAFNTLGVIYLKRGDAARAERVLQHALAADPDNAPILANEVLALHDLGREADAQAVREHLARVEPTPPFYWFVRGQAAMRAGDFEGARTLFLKELGRAPDYHEFHFALAAADFNLGRLDEARHELGLALQDAVKRTDHDLYAAKLDKLRSLQRDVSRPQPTLQ